MALRVPLYLAVNDLISLIEISFNLWYGQEQGHPMPELWCRWIAAFSLQNISMSATLVCTVAVMTYFRGKFAEEWCILAFNGNHEMQYVWLAINFFAIGSTIFCYVQTLRAVYRVKRMQLISPRFPSITTRRLTQVEKIITRKIVSYILVWLLQFVPIMIWVIGSIAEYDTLGTTMLVVIGGLFGGIGNAIQFILNEGWDDSLRHSSIQNSSKTKINQNSRSRSNARSLKDKRSIINTPSLKNLNIPNNSRALNHTSSMTIDIVPETFEPVVKENNNRQNEQFQDWWYGDPSEYIEDDEENLELESLGKI
ncbi:hypothetical protein G9A89_003562 [Geosiphon pyriformis]|nr:hypothetical protein G9A89_003562 [Geosiphon pyriformis]